MKIKTTLLAVCMGLALVSNADARGRHHHRHHVVTHSHIVKHVRHHAVASTEPVTYNDARPHAWCGWYMAHYFNIVGKLARQLWVAANWAHWGHDAGGPGENVVVVWPHHVGLIKAKGPGNTWIVHSGNDGHAVRTRPRVLRGVIAYRKP